MQQVVVVVNAEGVLAGRVQPNIEVMQEAGFLLQRKHQFVMSQDHSEILEVGPKFTSGPICALLLKRELPFDALNEIKDDLDDVYVSTSDYASLRDQTIFFPRKAVLERTVVIIKPGHSNEDYAAILQVLDLHDFVVVGKAVKMISTEQATAIFDGREDDVKHVTSDICVALTVEKMSAVEDMLLLLGPEDPELARSIVPNTLRAMLGKTKVDNVLYCSASHHKATQDIGVLFPEPFELERTLALIKPDAIESAEEVRAAILEQGFSIICEEKMYISKQRAEELYANEKNEAYFESLAQFMSSGALIAMILSKPGAVRSWQTLIGPADPADARIERPLSLRALYGTDEILNAFHASESSATAATEIDIFFPNLASAVIPSQDKVETLMKQKADPRPFAGQSKSLHDVLVEGLTQLCKVKPVGNDAIRSFANWLLVNNPNKPVVELPAEEVVVTSVVEQVEQVSGDALSIVWIIGSPGSKHRAPCEALATNFDYEFISTTDVLISVQKSGSEFGRSINQYLKLGRPLPTHIVINVLKDAILSSKKSKILIHDFPANLDMAFHFEKTIKPVDCVLFFEGPEQELLKEAFDGDSKSNKTDILKQLDDFNTEGFPVVEHYQAFEKVKSISALGSQEAIYKRLVAEFV